MALSNSEIFLIAGALVVIGIIIFFVLRATVFACKSDYCDTNGCGTDPCGNSCGSCASGFSCVDGVCEQDCVPDCTNKTCGPDGCGGLCNSCDWWNPADVSPMAWYDAADANTITLNGSNVSQWDDKSGNGRHVGQGDPSSQPTKAVRDGLDVLEFNNSVLLTTANASWLNSTAYTIFAVVQYDDIGPFESFYIGTSEGIGPNNSLIVGKRSTNPGLRHSHFGFSDDSIYTWNTDRVMFTHIYRSPGSDSYANGNLLESTSDELTSDLVGVKQLNIGSWLRTSSSLPINGAISEVIITGALSDTDRQKVEGYLAHKWDLTENLPADHPYKNTLPTI